MSLVKMHISMDEEMRSLLEELAAREKRSLSELMREALRQYARRDSSDDRRAAAKARIHAAIDRAAGAWSQGAHPETLDPQTYRKWREELWRQDQAELEAHAK